MSVPWYLMAKGKGGGGYKTASGPIVSINDALAAPLRSLLVNIDPVQDLHGYDAPWPAGGGKNKFDPQYFTGDVDTIYLNFHGARNVATAHGTHVKANTTYTCTIQLPTTPSASWGVYGFYANDSATTITFSANGIANPRTFSFTPTEDTDVIMWAYMSGSGNTWSNQGVTSTDNVRVQIEQGSTATSYAPYSNLCPISGWSAANLWRTGKNLLNLVESEMTSSGWNRRFPITIKAGTYFFSCQNQFGNPNALGVSISFFDSNNNSLATCTPYEFGDSVFVASRATVITDDLAKKITQINFACRASGTTFNDIAKGNIQLELGSTPTPYTPYTGNQYTIQLGQTVYGGYISVSEDGSAELVVDRAEVDLGSLTWKKKTSYTGKTAFQTINEIADMKPSTGNTIVQPIQCSQYKSDRWDYTLDVLAYDCRICEGWAGHAHIGICDSSCNELDGTEFKTAMSGVQLVYELATPITIPLSDITISTLQGQNVVWGDCGDVTVEYLSADGANPDLMKLAVAFMGRK